MIKKIIFIYAVTLLIVSESCLGMQHNTTMLSQPTERLSTSKEDKNLKTIFSENKELLIRHKIEPVPTGQNVNELLWEATWNGDYKLVEEIIGAMGDLIEQYTQLYQAVRDGEKGIEILRNLLEKDVNPNGYASHCSADRTPIILAKYLHDEWANDAYRGLPGCLLSGLKKDYKRIQELLEEKGFKEESPLEIAYKMENYAAIKLLLSHGAYDMQTPPSSIFIPNAMFYTIREEERP